MRDAERVESAHSRSKTMLPTSAAPSTLALSPEPAEISDEPTPMDIGSVNIIRKLSPAERERMLKEGRCLRCREKGHYARNCPRFAQS